MEMKNNRGGSRKGAGRPKGTTGAYKDVSKTVYLQIRVTPEEKRIITANAEKCGKSLSKYILDLLLPSVE